MLNWYSKYIKPLSSITNQFHKFFHLIFGEILSFWSNLEAKNGGWFLDSCCGENKTVKEVMKKGWRGSAVGSRGARAPPPYILVDQLNLFKTGGADYAHHYTTCPPPPIVSWIEVKVAVLCPRQYMPKNLILMKVFNKFWYFKHQILTRIGSEAYLRHNWRNCKKDAISSLMLQLRYWANLGRDLVFGISRVIQNFDHKYISGHVSLCCVHTEPPP